MSTLKKDTGTRAIVIEDVLPHSPETIWRVLTDSAMLGRWLMQNTFRPEVGHKFTFQARPMGDWNGIVECEVLEVDPPRKLSYTWIGGAAANSDYGSALDSVLTITLTPVPEGTQFKLVHDGFQSPRNDFAFVEMGKGWGKIVERIEGLARELA